MYDSIFEFGNWIIKGLFDIWVKVVIFDMLCKEYCLMFVYILLNVDKKLGERRCNLLVFGYWNVIV